jgi:hypothetical protein
MVIMLEKIKEGVSRFPHFTILLEEIVLLRSPVG